MLHPDALLTGCCQTSQQTVASTQNLLSVCPQARQRLDGHRLAGGCLRVEFKNENQFRGGPGKPFLSLFGSVRFMRVLSGV